MSNFGIGPHTSNFSDFKGKQVFKPVRCENDDTDVPAIDNKNAGMKETTFTKSSVTENNRTFLG